MPRTTFRLAAGNGFTVDDVRIVERSRAWSAPEVLPGHRLVFVRRGLFRLRLSHWDGVVDPLMAYVRTPDTEQRIAHRPDQEDACTEVTLDRQLTDDALPNQPLTTTPRVDLAQRALLARARHGADEFELTERVLRLVELITIADTPRATTAPPTHQRLTDAARELLTTDPAWPSFDLLARQLGVTRPHLSRVFRAVAGESLTRCRARLRVRAALDQLEAGQRNLAGLASELGFADHAHLTRTLVAELGSPPSRLRALLRGPA